MKQLYLCVLLVLAVQHSAAAQEAKPTAFDFSFESIEGDSLPLSQFEGQTLLVVNTASFCGFTSQYNALQSIWEKYKDRGLIVLGVPSNDFGNQEPGTAEEIKEFCTVNYGIDFPMTEKVAVKGTQSHPFYAWIRDTLGANKTPKWNFHKYLISFQGEVVASFPSGVSPDSLELVTAIEKALALKPGKPVE